MHDIQGELGVPPNDLPEFRRREECDEAGLHGSCPGRSRQSVDDGKLTKEITFVKHGKPGLQAGGSVLDDLDPPTENEVEMSATGKFIENQLSRFKMALGELGNDRSDRARVEVGEKDVVAYELPEKSAVTPPDGEALPG